jgi:hypothetical protein
LIERQEEFSKWVVEGIINEPDDEKD